MAGKNAFDSKLVKKAQQGDAEAREHLMKALDPLLRAFFIKRIGFKSEVDDLIQNTLMRVHKGLERFEGSVEFKSLCHESRPVRAAGSLPRPV